MKDLLPFKYTGHQFLTCLKWKRGRNRGWRKETNKINKTSSWQELTEKLFDLVWRTFVSPHSKLWIVSTKDSIKAIIKEYLKYRVFRFHGFIIFHLTLLYLSNFQTSYNWSKDSNHCWDQKPKNEYPKNVCCTSIFGVPVRCASKFY